ncbi:formate efflux transporter [Agrilactobacillus composti DSM 18527 = JCM 14202]|nr:formate efflux transporter [Agrilactobacillus composti DSM 18527 = JCM 14202]
MFLGIMAGAYIAIGYLAFIRVSGSTPKEWGSFSTFLGGCLFIPNWLISYHIFGWGVSHR